MNFLNLGGRTALDSLNNIGIEYSAEEAARSQLPLRHESPSQPGVVAGREGGFGPLPTTAAAAVMVSGGRSGGAGPSGGGNAGGAYYARRSYYATSDDDDYENTTTLTGVSGVVSLGPRVVVHHHRDHSLGFTFSGFPTDVVRFLSCISFESNPITPPTRTGPFDADILGIILLYLPVNERNTIVQVSRTCRFWRFYSNYAPHWTHFRRMEWGKRRLDLPRYIRNVVVKPKVVTREEYYVEKCKVEEYKRRDQRMSTVRHIRWCLAVAIMVAAMTTVNFVVAYLLGLMRTALRTDFSLGITTFIVMVALAVLEVTVVIIPLGGASSPTKVSRMARILSWGMYLCLIAVVFGIISALSLSRVQMSNRVLNGPTLDFTEGASCEAYLSKEYPSFALLPAALWDLRWRPLTMDPTEETFIPFCMKQNPDDDDDDDRRTQCYVLLFFDEHYASSVFHNATALERQKDVGTRLALNFDPTNRTGAPAVWCSDGGWPPMIALAHLLYDKVRVRRDRTFPNSAYLDPSARPVGTSVLSYRCSSAINRADVEFVRHSTEVWFQWSPAWRYHYIPLLSDAEQQRWQFEATHDHFFRYAYTCYIIAGVLWLLILVVQCTSKSNERALAMLGGTTVAAMLVMNPVTLALMGILCVVLDENYFMCSNEAGGAMIGGGIGLTALALGVYVCW